jgi:hypothetical protein
MYVTEPKEIPGYDWIRCCEYITLDECFKPTKFGILSSASSKNLASLTVQMNNI